MLHTAGMSIPETLVPSSGCNKPPPRPLRRILADQRNTAP